jgi:hypothetical protein
VIFFFDRCVSVRLARMLDAFDKDHTVRHQDNDGRFEITAEDTFIVATLSQDSPKPVFITCDANMYTRNPVERRALRDSGLTCVFIRRNFNNLTFHQQAVKLLTLWPQVTAETAICRVPTAFEITAAANKLQRLGPTSDL